jgi:Animal haem peroxidase.
LDASVVYGNTEELANRLRTFQKGELKMFITPDGRELLPVSTDPLDGCNEKQQNAQGRYCFMSGKNLISSFARVKEPFRTAAVKGLFSLILAV